MANNSVPVAYQGSIIYDWNTELAKRTFPGYRVTKQLACHESLSFLDGTVVVGDMDDDHVYPETEDYVTVVSDDADDDIDNITGDGAQSITLFGVDINGDSTSESIDMQGLTPVQSTKKYLRVSQMTAQSMVLQGGKANVGSITVTHNTAGLLNRMVPGSGRECISNFYTWRGQRWYVDYMLVSTTGKARLVLQQRSGGSGWSSAGAFVVDSTTIQLRTIHWLGLVPQNRDIRLLATCLQPSAIDINVQMDLLRVSKQQVAY